MMNFSQEKPVSTVLDTVRSARWALYQSWSSRGMTNQIYANIERELYFKQLAHVIFGADKSEICTGGQKAGNESKS